MTSSLDLHLSAWLSSVV
uniref:Uncharacterized protein n=1 Tax=Arundo donax TaxID=35708 RepID=A0A0A9EMY0_ARUDO